MSSLPVRLRVFLLASVVLSACSVYDETSGGSAGPGTRDDAVMSSADAGADAGESVAPTPPDDQACGHGQCWWSQQLPDECLSSGVPGPSDQAGGDQDGDTIDDFYLAWFRTQLGETSNAGLTWQQYGFDLDNTCTNASTCSEVRDAMSCRSATARIPFDGELCRDNSFGSLHAIVAAMPDVGERFGFKHDIVNCGLWHGDYSIVMRVSGYNGQADDDEVRLDLYAGTGLQTPLPWSCPSDDFESQYPHWRKSVAWNIDSGSFSGEITSKGELPDSNVRTVDAYVREGYLVATFPDDVVLRFMGDREAFRGFAFTLHGSVWTGKLTRSQDSTWEISDGLVGGRMRKADFVRTFREQGLCTGPLYNDLLGYIEESLDLSADGENDAARSCDAISFAIGFDAASMTPGDADSVPPLVECCPPERPLAECNADCGDGRITGTERCDTAIAAGSDGACPTSCPSSDPCVRRKVVGKDCEQTCEDSTITEVGMADACCPAGANSTVDADCPSVCGNQIVESGETCDPQTDCAPCVSDDPCLEVQSSGSADACNARCTLVPKTTCSGGDQCCPAGCDTANDSDCSQTCGNGTIEENESCEPEGAPSCPASCDDGDVCTTDLTSGAADSCSLRCTHLKVTEPRSEDGCCPAGANANTDSDCTAACGNGKLEGDEQCDDGNASAGDGCSASCAQETAQETCRALWLPDSQACAECGCASCAPELVACLHAANEDTRALCTPVVECAARERCFGQECYCGSANPDQCANGNGNGPCREQIERAAGTTDPVLIRVISLDPTTPLGIAFTPRFCFDALCGSCTGN
jgi:cysteine-rich repeat protein